MEYFWKIFYRNVKERIRREISNFECHRQIDRQIGRVIIFRLDLIRFNRCLIQIDVAALDYISHINRVYSKQIEDKIKYLNREQRLEFILDNKLLSSVPNESINHRFFFFFFFLIDPLTMDPTSFEEEFKEFFKKKKKRLE